MIGIQLDGDGGAVAVWRDSAPEVIGRGSSVAELVALANAQGVDCGSGVVAVPAWFNDEQRMQILTQAKEAGVATVRIMNEPTAATLAYGASQAALPEKSMVLSFASSGAFDVTLIAVIGSNIEVLAANGIAKIEESTPDQFFAAIKPVVNRALSDARLKPQSLNVIIMTGATGALGSIASEIEACWGLAPVEPHCPETAIACGAAVFGGFLESRQESLA
ncbi:MAG: Hsp70 family protein [Pirellulaceae bacterium]